MNGLCFMGKHGYNCISYLTLNPKILHYRTNNNDKNKNYSNYKIALIIYIKKWITNYNNNKLIY